LSDRFSRSQVFFYSFLLQGMAFVLMAAVPGMPSFIVAAVLLGVTLRAAYTVCAASAGDYVAVQFSAAAFGLMSFGAGLGSAISPTVGGAIADSISMNWTFTLASASSLTGMAGSIVLSKRPPRLVEAEATS
jgi:MFS family permease